MSAQPRRRQFRSLLIAGVLLVAASSNGLADDAGQPVPVWNGDFEQADGNWRGEGKFQIVDTAKHAGERSLRVEAGHAFQPLQAGKVIAIEPGADYKLSVWIRTEGCADRDVTVGILPRDAKNAVVGTWMRGASPSFVHDAGQSASVISTGGTHDWKQFVAMIPAAQIDTKVRTLHVYLRHDAVRPAQGVAYFDDLTVERFPAGTVTLNPVVNNGDFERGKAGWWGPALDKSAAAVEDVEGVKALKLTSDWVCQDKIAIAAKEGRRYRVSMKIRCDGASEDSVNAQLSFRGPNVAIGWFGPARTGAKGGEPALYRTGGTHEWKTFSVVVEPPRGADQILIYLRRTNGATGDAYFDDVHVESTDAPATTAAELKRQALSAKWLAPAIPSPDAEAALNAALALSKQPVTAPLVIADAGTLKYDIHVGGGELIALNAGIDLANHLKQISGAGTETLSSDASPRTGKPMIVIGRDSVWAQKLCPDIAYDSLGRDGFVIRTVGPHIVIAGATPRGTMYGVNWLLDRKFGVRWFAPDCTVVPTASTLTLATTNETHTPRFAYREVFSSEAHNDAFAARNLLNGRSHGRSFYASAAEIDDWESWWTAKGGDANFFDLVPQAKYGKAHPDWYAGGQVAMMNKELRAEMAKNIIARLQQLKDYRSVVFNVHDMDWGWDMDAASAAFAKQHGGHASAPRLDMMIDIANRVREVLPEARLSFNAYHWSFTPPEGMKVPDYLLVFPMTIHVDYSQPLFGERNKQLAADLEGWTRMSKNVLVWDHTVNFFGFLQPTPNLYPICESIQWLAKNASVIGYFAEDSWMTPGAEHAALRTWVMSRLLWDPKQDYRALIGEFLVGYYGPKAAPFMQQYIDLTHQSMKDSNDTFREKTTVLADYLNLDFLTAADALLAKAAEAAADSPEHLRHVQTTRMAIDYPILVRRTELAETARQRNIAWDPQTEARSARLVESYAAAGVKQYIQGGGLKELQELIAIDRKPTSRPDIVKDLPDADWREYQDLAFTRYGSKTVADPAASDGVAIRLDGNNTVWAAQFRRFKLPTEGKWDLYMAVRIDKAKEDDALPAVNVGSSPPMGRFTSGTVGELSTGEYKWIKVAGSPMTHRTEDEQIVYIQPRQGVAKYIYMDRLVAIRHRD